MGPLAPPAACTVDANVVIHGKADEEEAEEVGEDGVRERGSTWERGVDVGEGVDVGAHMTIVTYGCRAAGAA